MSKYQIKIKEPCHENWNTMSSHEQGKFCGVCTKEVVDFTAMRDEEVKSYFANYKGSLCGRFNKNQLEQKDERYFGLSDYTKKFIRALAMVFIMFSATESSAQIMGEPAIIGDISVSQSVAFQAQGMVFGPTGSGIPNARIQFRSKGKLIKEVVTDAKGEYSIRLEPNTYQLTISKKGFQDFQTSITVNNTDSFGDFELKKGVSSIEKKIEPIIMGKMRIMGKPSFRIVD